jgi:hypothetical protein
MCDLNHRTLRHCKCSCQCSAISSMYLQPCICSHASAMYDPLVPEVLTGLVFYLSTMICLEFSWAAPHPQVKG